MKQSFKTGYVYDHDFLKHTQPGHPESDKRLEYIISELEKTGIINSLHKVEARDATLDELKLGHNEDYIHKLKQKCEEGVDFWDMDTYLTPFSYYAACKAAGSLIDLTEKVVKGDFSNGFALVRPPGHHALTFRAMGFCLFNNVALAAKNIIKNTNVERIAIVDFDVHHGNGTQAICEEDKDILYISSHQFPYYPGTGNYTETGRGEGEGATINLPLPQDTGDKGFNQIYSEVVIPVLKRFDPQLILVSAGYDTHWADPLAGLGLSLEGFHSITKMLVTAAKELCNGKIVFTLEGGYDLHVQQKGVANAFRVLLNKDEFDDPVGKSPYSEPDISEYLKLFKDHFKIS